MSATALRIVEVSSMDKSKALAAALSQIERQFGKGSVMKLGKNDRSMDIETISSGSLNCNGSISSSSPFACPSTWWSVSLPGDPGGLFFPGRRRLRPPRRVANSPRDWLSATRASESP